MIGQLRLLRTAQACGCDDGFQLLFGVVQVIVDQHKIISAPMADLVPAFFHAAANGFGIILAALFQTIAQFGD